MVLLSGLLCGSFEYDGGGALDGAGRAVPVEESGAECEEMTVTVLLRNIGTLSFVITGGFSVGEPAPHFFCSHPSTSSVSQCMLALPTAYAGAHGQDLILSWI